MRCLALAQAWQERTVGATAVFAMNASLPALDARLSGEDIRVEQLSNTSGSEEDASATARLARAGGFEWIVVDGYVFGAEYQRTLKDAGLKLLVIDDYGHSEHYYCDLLLNQNIKPSTSLYRRREKYTGLLLGTHYALLRREFWSWVGWERQVHNCASRLLVTMGGADPTDVTGLVLDALELFPFENLEVRVVVGAANARLRQLSARVARDGRFELLTAVGNMPELMAWADVAVSAAGSTMWELLFMQLPTVSVAIAENQRPVTLRLHEMGAPTFQLSPLRIADLAASIQVLVGSVESRRRMAQLGREMVDGQGAKRVVQAMTSNKKLSLRPVGQQDCRLLWEWASDPEVRRVSFNQNPIPWDTHVSWFEKRLLDHETLFFIGVVGDLPVGQLRYDVRQNEAVVSICVDPKMRGKGYASRLIELGSQQVFGNTGVELIHAYVKPENKRSARAFMNAGFEACGTLVVDGQESLHFVQKKSGGRE